MKKVVQTRATFLFYNPLLEGLLKGGETSERKRNFILQILF